MNIEIPKTTETDDIFDYGFDKNLIRVAEQDSKTASEKTAVYNSLTDSVSASLITSGDLKSEITMIDGHLQSANYVAGTTGWRMDADGNLDANTGTFRGDITIGTGNNVFKADSNGIYLGDATYASAPFRVSMAGALAASSVNVSGAITTGVGSDIKGEYIESLSVSKLTTGEIKSKQITLSFTDNDGDCYIAAGKTDFDHDETGFIMGIDDSDSNKVKFIIGTPTEYLMVDGNTLVNTLRVGRYTPGSATLISSDAEKSDSSVTSPTIMKQIKMGRDGTYRVSWQMRCVNTQPDSRHCYWQLNRGGYWNGDVISDVSTSVKGYADTGWFDIPGTHYVDGTAVYNQSFYLFGFADSGVTCYVRNFRVKVNAVNEVAAPSIIVA